MTLREQSPRLRFGGDTGWGDGVRSLPEDVGQEAQEKTLGFQPLWEPAPETGIQEQREKACLAIQTLGQDFIHSFTQQVFGDQPWGTTEPKASLSPRPVPSTIGTCNS